MTPTIITACLLVVLGVCFCYKDVISFESLSHFCWGLLSGVLFVVAFPRRFSSTVLLMVVNLRLLNKFDFFFFLFLLSIISMPFYLL